MRLIIVDGRLVHTDGLLRLQRVVIRLNDGKTQLLLGACRLEARRQDGDLGAVDAAARLAAVPDIDAALDGRLKPRRRRVAAIIPISADRIAARSADVKALFTLRLAERSKRRLLRLLRDLQICILRKRKLDRARKRKVGSRRHG